MALLPGFIGLGGTSKRVKNLATGQEMSRTYYTTHFKRGNISPTELAKINKENDALASISRPARGRASIQKLAPSVKTDIAKIRIEHEKEKKARELAERKIKRANDKIERLNKRQTVKVPKFTRGLLKAGNKARRISFNDFGELLELLKGAKATGDVFSYSVGAVGISLRDPLNPTLQAPNVIRGRHINMKISEEEFDQEMTDYLESVASYFHFLHYYVQLAFTEKFYEQKAKAAGFYRNPEGKWIKPQSKKRKK